MNANGSYMKRSHARTLQLSTQLSGHVFYAVLTAVYFHIKKDISFDECMLFFDE